jgi:2-polyprenyl-6-methoxyphenol hydroxylase-like FAD-dependent oxidoreductase
LLLQPTGQAVLAELGLLEAALACGAPVKQLFGDTRSGRVVMDMYYARLDAACFGLGIQRGALFTLLRDAYADHARVRCGVAIVEMDAVRGTLRDEDGGAHGNYDLVVLADGAASRLRPRARVRRDAAYPWGAFWCLCADPGQRFAERLIQRYDGASRFAGILPVGRLPGEAESARQCSFFWSLRTDEFERVRAGGLEAWRDAAMEYWPDAAPLLSRIERFEQLAAASYRDAVLDRFHEGRCVVLGDAAHAMSPQLGQGANMALMDAGELAQALQAESDVDRALLRYDRARRSHVGVYQFLSRWLTPLFQSDSRVAAALRDALFGPLGRAPLARGEMLKVLAGIKRGWFGALPMPQRQSGRVQAAPLRETGTQ